MILGSSGLRYFVVCNRSQRDISVPLEERHANETTFFTTGLWSSVPKEQAGVGALKARLNALLIEMSRRSFQLVTTDVHQRLRNARSNLQGL